jgi:uncharacterized membrane protein YidH (DUF202 family)
MLVKVFYVIIFVLGSSQVRLAFLGIILAAYFINDFLQFKEQREENREQPMHHLALNVAINLISIPLFAAVCVIEANRVIFLKYTIFINNI